MRMKQYEVVVVGCGPGGAIAGKFAALNGASTLIIEEKRQIGVPSHDLSAILYDRSEMEETVGQKIEAAAVHSKVKGLAWISPGGKQGKAQPLPDAISIDRTLFEKSLAIGAIRAGAEIELHARVSDLMVESGKVKGVTLKNGKELVSVPCSLVIAADGSYGHIARMAGIGFTGGAISIPLGCEFFGVKPLGNQSNMVEIYLDDSGESRFQTVFPHGGDRFFVGSSVARGNVKQKKSLKLRLEEFIGHLEKIGRYDFSKASPVSMMSGGMVSATSQKLASDGIILVGNAAGPPLYGSRSGGRTMMLGACWTGRVTGEIAARAIRKGDISGMFLDREYKDIINQSLKGEGANISEALGLWRQIFTLNSEEQERVVEDVGLEIAALHFYSKGALPLAFCREPVKKWLRDKRRSIG